MSADFLLELRCEEIPARMQARARNDLARLLAEELGAAGIEAEAIDVWSTPRRLALIARGLPLETQASREEVKGPRTSAPAQALEGFLRKTGLAQEQLEERDGVWFAVVETPGRPTGELLAGAVERIVRGFAWPKSMRWGEGELRWVRPLQGIVAMLGEAIVPVEIDGIVAGATTVGHRFHHPGAITLGGAQDYAEKLRACHVVVDQVEREAIIRDGAVKAAAEAGLELIADEGLVVENAGLTEWPVPLLGRFDADYLDVPREVIVLTMRTNQKYFACTDDGGALAPAFVCVANIDANDDGKAIVEGNRRVLAARLADARFFWEQDLKVPLEEQAKKLGGIVFHEKLGTVADKVDRVAHLARWLAEEGVVKDADPNLVERAARLAKADLVSGMVGEFPELQGLVGGHLARAQGEPNVIADAIGDHYRPLGQGDEAPTVPVTVAVALADKLDTVIGFVLADLKPTGSKDPFAVRRAALSAITLITSNGLRLRLIDLFLQQVQTIRSAYISALNPDASLIPQRDMQLGAELMGFSHRIYDPKNLPVTTSIMRDVLEFLADRLKVQQREAGVRHDLIDAVFALGGEDDLVRLLARVTALQGFVETGEGRDLLAGYKRAANILKKEKWESEKRDSRVRGNDELDGEEKALIDALEAAEPKATAAIEAEDFTAAMAALASLRGPIDAFFDKVTVNDPDATKRERRLNLLLRFRDAVQRVADFSRIEG